LFNAIGLLFLPKLQNSYFFLGILLLLAYYFPPSFLIKEYYVIYGICKNLTKLDNFLGKTSKYLLVRVFFDLTHI